MSRHALTSGQFGLGSAAKAPEELYVWDIFVRIFHWSLLAAFSVAFYYHQSEWDRLIHVNAGYIAGGLLFSRIVWGFMKTGYASFHAFPPSPLSTIKYLKNLLHGHARRFLGHNPAGAIVIYSMLLCGLATVISGFLVYNDGWLAIDSHYPKIVHYYAPWTWLFLIILHVLGVITESLLHHDNLIKAMITGYKRSSRPEEKSFKNRT